MIDLPPRLCDVLYGLVWSSLCVCVFATISLYFLRDTPATFPRSFNRPNVCGVVVGWVFVVPTLVYTMRTTSLVFDLITR